MDPPIKRDDFSPVYMGVSKNSGKQMDGEHNGQPYDQMDDLGGTKNNYFWFNSHIAGGVFFWSSTFHHCLEELVDSQTWFPLKGSWDDYPGP